MNVLSLRYGNVTWLEIAESLKEEKILILIGLVMLNELYRNF